MLNVKQKIAGDILVQMSELFFFFLTPERSTSLALLKSHLFSAFLTGTIIILKEYVKY